MPLNTTVNRNGKTRKIRWGHFHVAAMTLAAAIDSREGKLYELLSEKEPDMLECKVIPLTPDDVFNLVGYHIISATPLNDGQYTMQSEIKFRDVTDGELFALKAGDVLHAWRDF